MTLMKSLGLSPRTLFRCCCVSLLSWGFSTLTLTPAHAGDSPLSLSLAATLKDFPQDADQDSSPAATAKAEFSQLSGDLPREEIRPFPKLPQAIDLTATPDDLWDRIRNGFSMPNLRNDLVLYHEQYYVNRPDYVRRMVERSSRYLYYIVDEIGKRGMPMELALLPMVESAYNPMALSRSHASGIWQFIPSTGKNFNLKQNWWVDQRRDIVASTSAALDYLQSLYDMYGDWQLALAAYNWGEGALARAVAKNQSRGLPTDYQSLTLPNETRNYVPKLQALKNIFSNQRLFAQLNLPPIANRPYFSTVAKATDIDVKMAAKLAEMPMDEFLALNPAHNRPVIKANSPLILPTDKVEIFKANLENTETPLSSWASYTLQKGERLEDVAARFDISVAALKNANGLDDRGRVAPGTPLLVPNKEGADTGDLAAITQAPEMPVAQPTPAPAPRNTPTLAATAAKAGPVLEAKVEKSAAKTHTLRKGDTLFSLARRYDVAVEDLKHWNPKLAKKMTPGAELIVAPAQEKTVMVAVKDSKGAKDEGKSAKDSKAGKKSEDKDSAKKEDKKSKERESKSAKAEEKSKTARYTIRKGDTLVAVARKFKVDADDLKRWNHLAGTNLKPGKTLTIQLAKNDKE